MFVFSIKTSKKKLLSYVFVGLIFLAALLVFFTGKKDNEVSADTAASIGTSTKITASSVKNNKDRREYLKTFGWETSEEAIDTRDVAIPRSFNDVYEKYNAIQKAQGFDLAGYKGVKCRRYTYLVTNYPFSADTATGSVIKPEVRANVLIYEGKVIGGDVCSTDLDGFMHGFSIK